MLLQIRTTNAVKSWHKALKYSIDKGTLRKISLTGCAKHVKVTTKEYDQRARKAELDFRTKRHPKVIEHPWMESLPYLVQLLIIKELQKAKKAWEEANDSNGRELLDEVSCDYKFYRSYQLPCRHIWTNNFTFSCLRDKDFERYKLI